MTLMKRLLGASAVLALSAVAALADPAIIYDVGGKNDKSFNEAAFQGAQRWATETGGTFKELEMQNEAQREQALRQLAEAGANPIVMTGFAFGDALNTVAADYPDTKFAIIDMVVDQPNVKSVVFTEDQGSYLAGVMAGMASKSGVVGFIGGMDIPLIRRFGCGYAQGVKAVKADATVILNMTGSNQNYLHPGQVLTSMVKRVDNAVYDAFKEGADLKPGINVMDLAAGGVDVAMDDNNAALVTPEMKAAVEDAAAKIKSGELKVHDYMSDNTCPAGQF